MGRFGSGLQVARDSEQSPCVIQAEEIRDALACNASLAQVQRVLEQVARAVEFLFGFTLAAGLVVLFAAISATREERAREYAVMCAIGAQGRLLRQVQRAELAGVGLLAGLLAGAVLAMLAGWWGLRDVLRRPVVETLRRAPQ